MTLVLVDADASGYISSEAATYSDAREGLDVLTAFPDPRPQYAIGQSYDALGPLYTVFQAFLSFDLSAIPSGSTVTAVDLANPLAGTTGSSFTIEAREYDWGGGVLTTGDFVPGSAQGALTLLDTEASNVALSLDSPAMAAAVQAAVTAGDPFRIVLSSENHRTNTAPTGDEYDSHYGPATTGQRPLLIVTYTEPEIAIGYFGLGGLIPGP